MNISVRIPEAKIVMEAVGKLKPRPSNPRTHTKKQLAQLAKSIERFGFCNPLLIDEEKHVIAGHGRLEAARSLGMIEVPTLVLANMSEAEKRAYVIADNRLAELAGWSDELLAAEIAGISTLDGELDLELTGFGSGDIERLLEEASCRIEASDELPIAEVDSVQVSKVGDLWVLGEHCLYVGDALEKESYRVLLDGEKAQMVITDPPYNVPVSGHVCGLGNVKHREFAMASGEMSDVEFTRFLEIAFGHLADHSKQGSIHYVFMDWRHMREILAAGDKAYSELKNLIVWNKDNGGMGAFYRSKHELIFVFKSGTRKHVNNFGLGEYGRYRTNVWDYPGISSVGAGRDEQLAMHPTVKPVALIADAMRDCSRQGDTVLDIFGGSGTTIVAAEETGRKARVIELDPEYADVSIRRWQKMTGNKAVLAGDGRSFAEIEIDLRATPN